MAIGYIDQAAFVRDSSFRLRVEAGTMIVALSVDTLPTITGDPLRQRVELANKVISTSNFNVETFGVDQFCWALVGKQQVTNIGDFSDSQINTVIEQYWDRIAQAMIPPPGGP